MSATTHYFVLIIFLWNQISVLVDVFLLAIHSVSSIFVSKGDTLTAGITHGLHRPENDLWSEDLLFPTSERCPQESDQNDPLMLGNLLTEYWPETCGITYKAQATHGCCSPHFLLLHQHHQTGKKRAASSWSEVGRSVPAAFPADGSSERPRRPTPSAPAPLAPAAPFAPCGFHCSGPVFHPKHIKRHKLEVQLPNWSLGKQYTTTRNSYTTWVLP